MGLTIEATRFLLEARAQAGVFESVVTLGRQDLWVTPDSMERLLRESDLWPKDLTAAQFRKDYEGAPSRSEHLLTWLGAKEVLACDASGYEGAGWVHDLNEPIGADWEERFDLVLDGGTLEHVFNFPVALANCMRMTRPGGRIIFLTPANNYCGHGFYQFSPELFYRVLSAENGFDLERIEAVVDTSGMTSFLGIPYAFPIRGARYAVQDPARVRERVLLVNRDPTLLFVQAKKVRSVPVLGKPPLQSDYVQQWNSQSEAGAASGHARKGGWVSRLKRRLPETYWREKLPAWLGWLDPFRLGRVRRRYSFANRRHYARVSGPTADRKTDTP